MIRGTTSLPHGTGKEDRICFFCTEDSSKEMARELGIDIIGDESTIEQIKNGDIRFDKLYSTYEGLAMLKPHARVLGPKN